MFLQNILFVETNRSLDMVASYRNWKYIILILCLVTLFGILLEYYFTRERVTEEEFQKTQVGDKIPLATQIKACLTTPYWWLIIVYFLIFQLGGLVNNGSMSYYSRWMFAGIMTEAEAGTAMGLLGLIGGVPTALGMVIAWPIAKNLENKRR